MCSLYAQSVSDDNHQARVYHGAGAADGDIASGRFGEKPRKES